MQRWLPNSWMLWRISTELVVTSSERWCLQTKGLQLSTWRFFPPNYFRSRVKICTYLKVVVFNRRIYCSWSEIKLGKSIVYFSPIYWGTLTLRGDVFFPRHHNLLLLEFTPYFLVTWGRPKINGFWKWFFGCHGTFRVRISQRCRECCTGWGWYFFHVLPSPRRT